MKGIIVLFVLGVLASAVVAAVVAARLDRPTGTGRGFDFVNRVRAQRTSMASGLGGMATFLFVVFAALPPVVFIVWAVGMVGLRPPIWPANVRL